MKVTTVLILLCAFACVSNVKGDLETCLVFCTSLPPRQQEECKVACIERYGIHLHEQCNLSDCFGMCENKFHLYLKYCRKACVKVIQKLKSKVGADSKGKGVACDEVELINRSNSSS